ncbi:MAG TPA: hypothetical protein DCZ10_15680 [Pelotomaculum sp.]|nr:hypothetical protein [Pelotomaculum sp.]
MSLWLLALGSVWWRRRPARSMGST